MFKNGFPKTVLFLRYVEVYCTAGQATDNNMTNAHCILDYLIQWHQNKH
jgi:hypothetical protein